VRLVGLWDARGKFFLKQAVILKEKLVRSKPIVFHRGMGLLPLLTKGGLVKNCGMDLKQEGL
jgi:hypothetical protein